MLLCLKDSGVSGILFSSLGSALQTASPFRRTKGPAAESYKAPLQEALSAKTWACAWSLLEGEMLWEVRTSG